jgi:hypothetical protein
LKADYFWVILLEHVLYWVPHKLSGLGANKKPFLIIAEMGCPELGIWVGFLKQPALPGKAPQKKILQKKFKKIKIINKKSQMNKKYFKNI